MRGPTATVQLFAGFGGVWWAQRRFVACNEHVHPLSLTSTLPCYIWPVSPAIYTYRAHTLATLKSHRAFWTWNMEGSSRVRHGLRGSLSLSSRKMQSSLSLSLSCTRVCKEVLAGFHDTTRKLVSYTWVRGRSCLFQPAERSDFFGSIFAGFYITFSCLLFQFCFLLIFVKFVFFFLIFVEFCCVKMIVYVVKSDWLRYVFFYFFYVVYNIVCKINMIKVFFK